MSLEQRVIDMIKHHEGVRFSPYRCPALLWTVGVGRVIDPNHIKVKLDERKNLPIPDGWDKTFSMEEVDKLLQEDLARFENGVRRLCPNGLTPGRFGALVSLSFNIGLGNLQNSTLRMKHNRGEFESAADEFLKWNKAGGKELKGLTNRRKDERSLYLS
jgi:lysozyme